MQDIQCTHIIYNAFFSDMQIRFIFSHYSEMLISWMQRSGNLQCNKTYGKAKLGSINITDVQFNTTNPFRQYEL